MDQPSLLLLRGFKGMEAFYDIAQRDALTTHGHHLFHPDVPRPWSQWSEDQTLHVAVAYSNPFRWRTRRELFNDFRRHMASFSNVVLHVGELAYGDRPFEVTGIDAKAAANSPKELEQQVRYFHEFDTQFRSRHATHELWLKECLLNKIIETFPPDWQYGAYIDGDFSFTRHDWALEAIHLLTAHYEWVQLFHSYIDLGSDHRPFRILPSFAWNYLHQADFLERMRGLSRKEIEETTGYTSGAGKMPIEETEVFPFGYPFPGATGAGWAFRRSAFEAVGGLLDTCIVGSGDYHMALGLVQATNATMEMRRCTEPYVRAVLQWQERAATLTRNIGCLDQCIAHFWHGPKTSRFYGQRWKILTRHAFDPVADLTRDWQGLWTLRGNKPQLRDDLRRYFLSRNEDNPNCGPTERPMI